MDFCRNITVSGGLPSEYQPEQLLSSSSSKVGSLDDLFSSHNMEGDVSLEWLSIFVEDCFSSSGNYCLPPAAAAAAAPTDELQKSIASITTASSKPLQQSLEKQPHNQNRTASSLHKCFVIPPAPGKARSKRRRRRSSYPFTKSKTPRVTTSWPWSQYHRNHHQLDRNLDMTMTNSSSSDPPLLQQAYWLADSELIFPHQSKDNRSSNSNSREGYRDRGGEQEEGPKDEVEVVGEEEEEEEQVMVVGVGKENSRGGSCLEGQQQSQQPRRCSHCLVQRTPQWRAGPLGPKTLCNACGVRYKSGRLLPEYRPAKSPTFVSYKHSNSHKKVMEMRMSLLSSSIPPPPPSSS